MSFGRERAAEGEEVSTHGNRPWVYFMIDAFFLMVEFYVITFKVKVNEVVLPKRMPPGSALASAPAPFEPKRALVVHVYGPRRPAERRYSYMGEDYGLDGLKRLFDGASRGNEKCIVKVSYDADANWGEVMAVFNETSRARIDEVALIQLPEAIALPDSK
jgi:biopolymer transport protein ExbD